MNEEDIKEIYGDDVIILFKGSAPFTELTPHIPAGVVLENSEGKVICYECKDAFESLGKHLIFKHNMTGLEYKEKHGFNRKTPLCSRSLSAKLSEYALNNIEPIKERMLQARKETAKDNPGNKGIKKSVQSMNSRNTCPEQVLARVKLIIAKFGEDVDFRTVERHDPGLGELCQKRFGSWNQTKIALDITPNESNKRKDNADLIYDLRKFVTTNRMMPWYKGERTSDFSHSRRAYLRHFGSMSKVRLICGIRGTARACNVVV